MSLKFYFDISNIKDTNVELHSEDCRYKILMPDKYDLLKRYLFYKAPIEYSRNEISPFSENYGGLFKLMSEEHEVYYTSEIPGVMNKEENVYSDIVTVDGEEDVAEYNCIWWSEATLMKAKKGIINIYGKDNRLKEIKILDAIDELIPNREQKAAWKCLTYFIRFIKNTMTSAHIPRRSTNTWFYTFNNNSKEINCFIKYLSTENNEEKIWKSFRFQHFLKSSSLQHQYVPSQLQPTPDHPFSPSDAQSISSCHSNNIQCQNVPSQSPVPSTSQNLSGRRKRPRNSRGKYKTQSIPSDSDDNAIDLTNLT
ncbi:hypothetical protein O3M35_008671 [Rhynocoris fuscipes]|uniref:Decapping nuclease n=1 Tax=Rhynocoris fuscipes TaxID=488301 RepID=A0AAW1D9T9_9HEMI